MSQSRFLTEDIMINIFLRLPVASCIFRFRCVCKSWRILLSDPLFIRKILFFQTPADQQSLRLLITGGEYDVPVRQFYYSLHSYNTLCPISEAADAVGDLPSIPNKMRTSWSGFRLKIVGCCDGIFCISDKTYGGASDIILWNPTTSETKFLPLSLCPRPPKLRMCWEFIGFGFDSLTGDYKVVRTLKFRKIEYYDERDDNDREELDCPPPFTYKEVYSLRNDSWKRLIDHSDLVEYAQYVPHGNTSRVEKCYWCYGMMDKKIGILSFDMGKEVYEIMIVDSPFDIHEDYWSHSPWSCFMIKESFVTTFGSYFDLCDYGDYTRFQIWGLMKYGVAQSWTKLFTLLSPIWTWNINLKVWKDGMCMSAQNTKAKDKVVKAFIVDPATGKVINNSIEISQETNPYLAHTYTPTQISLSH